MDKKVPRLYEKCNARVIVEVNFSSARVELVPSAPPTPFYFHLPPSLLPPLLATRSIFFRADTSANRSTISFRSECHTTLWKPTLKTSVRDVPHEKRNRPISDSPPTVCMHRENLVFELRYTSWPHPVAGNVTKLPMKRRAVTFAISKRLEIAIRAPITFRFLRIARYVLST